MGSPEFVKCHQSLSSFNTHWMLPPDVDMGEMSDTSTSSHRGKLSLNQTHETRYPGH